MNRKKTSQLYLPGARLSTYHLSDQNYLCSTGVVKKSEGEKLGFPPPPALRKHYHEFNEIQVTQMLVLTANLWQEQLSPSYWTDSTVVIKGTFLTLTWPCKKTKPNFTTLQYSVVHTTAAQGNGDTAQTSPCFLILFFVLAPCGWQRDCHPWLNRKLLGLA